MNYWLMKSEPQEFSIDDLARVGVEGWEGVRNFQARNYLRAMQVGDRAFFYHSSCPEPGIVGEMTIVRSAYSDATALDRSSKYFDQRSRPQLVRWSAVRVGFVRTFLAPISLGELRTHVELADLLLLKKGNRLSVMPLSPQHWEFIHTLR